MRKIKSKVKQSATHVVVAVHKNSHKSRTVCEMLSCIFITIETHLLLFAVVSMIWLVIDLLDLIELTMQLGAPDSHTKPRARAARSAADREAA